VKFSSLVDEVFNIARLERQPDAEVAPPGFYVLDSSGYHPRSIGLAEADIPQLLQKIALLTETRGISLKTCFNDCSRVDCEVRSGRILPEVFASQFPLAKSTTTKPAVLSRAEVDMLIQRYCDDNGWFRLLAFERDIEAILGNAPDAVMDPDRIEFLLNKMHHNRTSSGNPLRPANCKIIGASKQLQLASGTQPSSPGSTKPPSSRPQSARFSMSGMRPYSARASSSTTGARGSVSTSGVESPRRAPSWNDTEPAAWMPSRLPKGPPAGRPERISRPQSATSSSRRRAAQLGGLAEVDYEVQYHQEVTDKLKEHVRQRRMRLYDTFRDRDRYCRGVCSKTVMQSVLGSLGFHLSAQEYADLLAAYPAKDGDFCYSDLCTALGEPHLPASSRAVEDSDHRPQQGAACSQGGLPMSPDSRTEVERIHNRIRAVVRGRGLEMLNFFVDFERRKWAKPGHVTVVQFARAMDNLQIRLSQREVSLLCSVYCDTHLENEFNYIDFCGVVDPIYVQGRTSEALRNQIRRESKESAKAAPAPSPYANPYYDRIGQVRPISAVPYAPPASTRWHGGSGNPPAGLSRRARPRSAVVSSARAHGKLSSL
jgi:hypothetical protein